MSYSNGQTGDTPVYGVEYRSDGPINHAQYRNMPCALCEATGWGDKIIIPSHYAYVCPDGWHKEYNGYIMAGYFDHDGGTMYYCIDESLEKIKGSGDAQTIHVLYTVHGSGSHVSTNGYAMTCVVCTKWLLTDYQNFSNLVVAM